MRRGKTRLRRHIPELCASAAATRPQKRRGTASAVRAALLAAHYPAFAQILESGPPPVTPLALRDPRCEAVAVKPLPRGQSKGCRPDPRHSSALRAGPSGDTLGSLRPCEKHPVQTAREAAHSMPPEHRGHTARVRWHKGWVDAPSLPFLLRQSL